MMTWRENENAWIGMMILSVTLVPCARALDYESDILPIMKEHCFQCHSEKENKVKGNLALDDLEDMRDYQRAKFSLIRPGNPEESPFLRVMKLGEGDDDFMPRKGTALPSREVVMIEQWISEGAVFKRAAEKKQTGSGAGKTAMSQQTLEWKNREGKIIKARFVRLAGDSVMLLLDNGKSYRYPLEKLSDESRAQAKKLAGGE